MFVIIFQGGEVHDGSELIGPAESFSDFLADSLSDCSSDGKIKRNKTLPQIYCSLHVQSLDSTMKSHIDVWICFFYPVQRDISDADDLTITSEYGGKVCLFMYQNNTHTW